MSHTRTSLLVPVDGTNFLFDEHCAQKISKYYVNSELDFYGQTYFHMIYNDAKKKVSISESGPKTIRME